MNAYLSMAAFAAVMIFTPGVNNVTGLLVSLAHPGFGFAGHLVGQM